MLSVSVFSLFSFFVPPFDGRIAVTCRGEVAAFHFKGDLPRAGICNLNFVNTNRGLHNFSSRVEG